MSMVEENRGRTAEQEKKFANYPDNSLGKQQREFDEVPSLHDVVLNHFKTHNQ